MNRPPRRGAVDPARLVAYEVLRAVSIDDAYANLVLPARIRRAGLGRRDAAFATELAYGTLRGLGFYDALIDIVAPRRGGIDGDVRDALRLGVHQLLGMRVAAHGAVDSTVTLVRLEIGEGAAKFANAVLRRIGERDAAAWREELSAGKSEIEALALAGSHPAWIVRAFKQALLAHGRRTTELGALIDADNIAPDPVLIALPGLLEPEALPGEPTALSPFAHRIRGHAPAELEEIASGRARVQDEGSQLVGLALAAAESRAEEEGPWLDLCAGPGGKAALLAALGGQRGVTLTAVEPAGHRAALVRDSLRALDGWEVVQADGRELAAARPSAFSRVLVDVPCTGLGALRRRPESRWRRSPADLPGLAPLQRELLEAGLTALAPGGVLAYTTCSPHIAETLAVLDDLLKRREDIEVLDTPEVLAGITGAPVESFASAARGDGRPAQLWPHVHGTDGMFIALLRTRLPDRA